MTVSKVGTGMRTIRTLFFGIGQGLKSIRRNSMFSAASICTMTACILLFGIFYFILTNIQHVVLQAETGVGITVFFNEGITDAGITRIGDKIYERPEVSKVEYTSAEDAWKNYCENNLNEDLVASFGQDNPLEDSASFTVYLNDVSLEEALVGYIEGLDGVRKVNDKAEVAGMLTSFNKGLTIVSAVLIVILICVAIFLISITVSTGVSVRKAEISIMKLIGATDFFIRTPFIVEGVVIGFVGAAIPLAVLYFAYDRITAILAGKLSSMFSVITFMPVSEVMRTFIPMSLALGIGIGFIGSSITLSRQLRKIEISSEVH